MQASRSRPQNKLGDTIRFVCQNVHCQHYTNRWCSQVAPICEVVLENADTFMILGSFKHRENF